MEEENTEKMKALTNEIRELRKTYEDELEREKIERDQQNIVDIEQTKILDEENKVKLELSKKEKEDVQLKEKKQLEEQKIFRNQINESLKQIENVSYSQKLDDVETRLIAIEKNTTALDSAENSSFYADVSILFFLWLILPMFLTYKGLDWFFDWM